MEAIRCEPRAGWWGTVIHLDTKSVDRSLPGSRSDTALRRWLLAGEAGAVRRGLGRISLRVLPGPTGDADEPGVLTPAGGTPRRPTGWLPMGKPPARRPTLRPAGEGAATWGTAWWLPSAIARRALATLNTKDFRVDAGSRLEVRFVRDRESSAEHNCRGLRCAQGGHRDSGIPNSRSHKRQQCRGCRHRIRLTGAATIEPTCPAPGCWYSI